jgi:homospermidine synthase
VELWEDFEVGFDWLEKFNEDPSKNMLYLEERTLYMRQLKLHDLTQSVNSRATCVIDHGMNPGLVSHFTKAALDRITANVLSKCRVNTQTYSVLSEAYEAKDYALLAQTLGSLFIIFIQRLKTVHISERDTQKPYPFADKREAEFLSTWSCEGFFEEGMDPVQVGWGTHEKKQEQVVGSIVPSTGQIFIPQHSIIFPTFRSYVPTVGEINGYNIPHSEGSTISEFLSVKNEQGDIIYRPTVHYVYSPPDVAEKSWNELFIRNESYPTELASQRVLSGTEIESGKDAVGVLLMFGTLYIWLISRF